MRSRALIVLCSFLVAVLGVAGLTYACFPDEGGGKNCDVPDEGDSGKCPSSRDTNKNADKDCMTESVDQSQKPRTPAAGGNVLDTVTFAPNGAFQQPGMLVEYKSIFSSRATKSVGNDAVTAYLGTTELHFEKDGGGNWQHVTSLGEPAADNWKLVPVLNDTDLSEDFTIAEQKSVSPRQYVFEGWDAQDGSANDGALSSIEQDTQTIASFSIDSDGYTTAGLDEYGRTTHYVYELDEGSNPTVLKYIVRSSSADIADMCGPVTAFKYNGSGDAVTEIWEGVPTDATPEYETEGDYDWHKTMYKEYDHLGEGYRMLYVVDPAHYEILAAMGAPHPDEDDYTANASRVFKFAGDTWVVSQVVEANCASCGGTDGGTKITEHSMDDLCPGANPTGYDAVAQQMNLEHPTQASLGGEVTWNTDEKLQYNAYGQVVIRHQYVKASGADAVLITKTLHETTGASIGRPAYEYFYSWNPANGIDTATLKRVVWYDYDNTSGFLQYEKVSEDDTNWTTKKQYARDSAGLLLTEYDYKDNNTAYATDYTYTSGRITAIQKPTVTVNWDKAGGADYRPTTVYTYNAQGDVQTVADTNDANAVVTKYLYAYDDGINQDGDEETDEADEGFMLTKVIVDYASPAGSHLNLTTVYGYTRQNGKWMLTSVTDPNSDTTEYEVDAWGRRTKETTPSEKYRTETTYDDNGRVTEVVRKYIPDPMNAPNTTYTLAKTQTTYDLFGHVVMEKEDPDGADLATVYRHDNAGHLRKVWTRVHDAGLDGSGNATGTVYGNVTRYTYQHTTDLISLVEQGARETGPEEILGYGYDVFGNKTQETRYRTAGENPETHDVDYVYDPQGRLTSVDGPGDAYTAYTYDERDLVTHTKHHNGTSGGALLAEEWTYYDEAARVYRTSERNPNDPSHDNDARTTNRYLDKAGRLCRVSDPRSQDTDTAYDTAGRPSSVTDAVGNIVEYTLDANGNVTRVKTRHKMSAVPTYRNEWVVTWYDEDNRAQTAANYGTNDPGASPNEPNASSSTVLVTQYAYGWDTTEGKAYSEMTDAAGTVARSFSDKLGRTTKVIEDYGDQKINRTTTYAYDLLDTDYYDSITALNGAEDSQVTKYWRDDDVNASRVTKVTYPDSTSGTDVVTYAFHVDGTPDTRVDQRGWTTTYAVNAGGRVDNEVVTGTGVTGTKNVRYTYDALGRLTQIEDDNGKTDGGNPDYDYSKVEYVYTWDASSTGFKVEEKHYLDGAGPYTVETKTNNAGDRSYIKYPGSGIELEYVFDAVHRLTELVDSTWSTDFVHYYFKGGYVNEKEYGAFQGTPVLKLTLKTTTDLDGYDAFGRIKKMRYYKPGAPATDVVKLQYQHDYASSPTWRYDELNNSGSVKWGQKYQYDALHRLVKAEQGEIADWSTTPTITADKTWVWNGSQGGTTYTLDQVGNWDQYYDNDVTDTRTHNTANEITARTVGGNSKDPSSDLAGNLTDDGENYLFTYDCRNRIIEVKRKGDSSLKAKYEYDGLNRRVRKVLFDTDGTTELSDTWMTYDGWRCLEERDHNDSNELRARYMWGGTYLDELIREDRDNNSDGDFTDAGTDYNLYVCQDANFNVVALTDASGNRLERVWYEAYGKPTFHRDSDDAERTTSSYFDNPYLFQGQRLDPETGLYYFKNRDYSAILGRFVQWDPIGYASGMDFYEAMASKPVADVDPYGAMWTSTSYERQYDAQNGDWKRAHGKGGLTTFVRCAERSNGCQSIILTFTYEWREFQHVKVITYHRSGESAVNLGVMGYKVSGAFVGIGVVASGVFQNPIPAAVGGALGGGLSVASTVLGVIPGGIVEGIDSLKNGPLPDTERHNMGEWWEYRNVSWAWNKISEYACDGSETIFIGTDGSLHGNLTELDLHPAQGASAVVKGKATGLTIGD